MEIFLGILLFAGIVVVLMVVKKLLSKGVNAAATAVNKNVLFKSEYNEQQQFISTTLTFVTTATKENIMKALRNSVAPAESVPSVAGVIYQLSLNADSVTYAFGSKFYPQAFIVSVALSSNGDLTQGQFKFLKWHESDGMLPSIEIMKKLRNNIIAAFRAADPSVKITEGVLVNH